MSSAVRIPTVRVGLGPDGPLGELSDGVAWISDPSHLLVSGDGNGHAWRADDGAADGDAVHATGAGGEDAFRATGTAQRCGTGEAAMQAVSLIGVICDGARVVGEVARRYAAGKTVLTIRLFRCANAGGERSFSLGDFDSDSWDEDLLEVAYRWMDTEMPFGEQMTMRPLGGYV